MNDELTDEEIDKIVKDCIEDDYHMISNPYAVAHMVQEAILRKAQEMNANELADELESCRDYELPEFVHKTATMLRQQHAEIEEWKRKYKDMHNLATQAMSKVHELEKAQEK